MGNIVLYRVSEFFGIMTEVKRDRAGTVVEYALHSDRATAVSFCLLGALVLLFAVGQFLLSRSRSPLRRWLFPGLCTLLFLYALLVGLSMAPCISLTSHAGFYIKELCGLGFAFMALFPLIGLLIGGFFGHRAALTGK